MSYALGQVKILIVDDMEAIVDITKSLLESFGFKQFLTANNVEKAYELFKSEKPDIVITDWHMDPPPDGMDLILKIRKGADSPNPYVPIIMMTGFAAKARVEKARDMGVTEILIKPFKAKDLCNRIVYVIEKPRQFVLSGQFFGPDRRRQKSTDYKGPERRSDPEEDEAAE